MRVGLGCKRTHSVILSPKGMILIALVVAVNNCAAARIWRREAVGLILGTSWTWTKEEIQFGLMRGQKGRLCFAELGSSRGAGG